MNRHHAVCVLCASGDDLCHLKRIVSSVTVSKNLAMIAAVYLSLSLPPVEFPTRKTLDYWLPIALVRWPWLRHVIETGIILSISLLLALLFPSSSAKVSAPLPFQLCKSKHSTHKNCSADSTSTLTIVATLHPHRGIVDICSLWLEQ